MTIKGEHPAILGWPVLSYSVTFQSNRFGIRGRSANILVLRGFSRSSSLPPDGYPVGHPIPAEDGMEQQFPG
jgi:hypothetical protein